MRKEFADKFKTYTVVRAQKRQIRYSSQQNDSSMVMSRYSDKKLTKKQKDLIEGIKNNHYEPVEDKTQTQYYYTSWYKSYNFVITPNFEEIVQTFFERYKLSSSLKNHRILFESQREVNKDTDFVKNLDNFLITPPIGALTLDLLVDENNTFLGYTDAFSFKNPSNPLHKIGISEELNMLFNTVVKRMMKAPKWDEKTLFYALSVLEFMASQSSPETTLEEYITGNEEHLYNNVFMKFQVQADKNLISNLSIFYDLLVFNDVVNILDENLYRTFEKMPYKEWHNVVNFSIGYDNNNPYSYTRFDAHRIINPKDKNLLIDYIDFAKNDHEGLINVIDYDRTVEVEEDYFVKILQNVWQDSVAKNTEISPGKVEIFSNYWKDIVENILGSHVIEKYRRAYAYRSVYFLLKNYEKLNTQQLFSIGMILADGTALYRGAMSSLYSDETVEAKKSRVVLKVLEYFEEEIVEFSSFAESLVFEYDGVLPTPSEWDKGHTSIDMDSLSNIPLSILHSMIKIYETSSKVGSKIPVNYKLLRKDIDKLSEETE